ncbi:MAG TPA: hypothetical protein GXZ87_00865 [Bacteroidales bacterium]|nr:hypothetical protein [Bacteroidales bacterium]
MPPVPITTFQETYQAYKNYYIARNGSNKFERIYDDITNSSKIDQILQWSINNRIAPNAKDFLIIVHTMSFFIIAKNETRAMGAIVALYYWNERVNRKYCLATEKEMSEKIKSVFGQLSMLW